MRGKIVLAGLVLGLSGIAVSAQNASQPFPNDVYCSGVVTTEAVPRDNYIITGEESNTKVVFIQNDYVFISKGSSQGVKAGDEFSVVRPVEDPIKVDWTKWQTSILHKMGTVWEDEGRLKVVEPARRFPSHRSSMPAGMCSALILCCRSSSALSRR